MKYNIFLTVFILFLIVGNIVCYSLNDRTLKPMTNVLLFGFIVMIYLKKSNKPN